MIWGLCQDVSGLHGYIRLNSRATYSLSYPYELYCPYLGIYILGYLLEEVPLPGSPAAAQGSHLLMGYLAPLYRVATFIRCFFD